MMRQVPKSRTLAQGLLVHAFMYGAPRLNVKAKFASYCIYMGKR